MARVRINWILIVVVVIGMVVLAGTAIWLRHWNRSGRASAGLTLGTEAFDEENWTEAAIQFGRYLSVHMDDADILYKYAKAQLNRLPLKREYLVQAVNSLRRILRQDPASCPDDLRRKAATLLVDLYLSLDQAAEAELVATQQIAIINDPALRRMLGVAYARQRKFTEAVDTLKTLIREHPSEIPAYAVLGLISENNPQFVPGSPQQWYDEAVTANPLSAQALILRAGYFLRPKKGQSPTESQIYRGKAIADIQKAQNLDISDLTIHLSLVEVLMNLGDYDRARQNLQSIRKIDPRNPLLWISWSNLARRAGDKNEMVQIAEEGLKEIPAGVFLPNAAELYLAADALDKVQECIEKLQQQHSAPGQIAFLQAQLAERRQQWPQALSFWRRVVEEGNNSELTNLRISAVYERLGDKDSAIQQLRTFASKQPDSFPVHFNLARLLSDADRPQDASDAVQIALRIDPDNPEARILYSRIRLQLIATGQLSPNDKLWESIANDAQVASANDAFTVSSEMIRFRIALLRQDFNTASRILDQLKLQYPNDLQVGLAGVSLLLGQDKDDQALEETRRIVTANPQSVQAIRALCGLLVNKAQFGEARDILIQALTITQKPSDKRDLAVLLVEIYALSDQLSKADELLKSLVEQMPDDILLKRQWFSVQLALKKTDNLQPLIDAMKAQEGQQGWQWRYEQARLWFSGDDSQFKSFYPRVVSLLKENLSANPDDQASRLLLGLSYSRAGEEQLALSTYQEAVNRDPSNMRAIDMAVSALIKAGQTAQADEILNQANRRIPRNERLSELELQSFLRQGKLESAGLILEEYIKNEPENNRARFLLARICIRKRDFVKAEELLTDLLTADYEPIAVSNLMVDLWLLRNKTKEAIRVADDLVTRVNTSKSYILRSLLHVRINQFDRARADLAKAVELEPDKIKKYLLQSEFHLAVNELPESINAVKSALAIAPDDPSVLKTAVLVLSASPDSSDRASATAFLDKGLRQLPNDPALLLTKARLLLSRGTSSDVDQAIGILEKLSTKEAPNEQVYSLLASAYQTAGDTGKSIETVLRGLKSIPDSKNLLLIRSRLDGAASPAQAIPTLKLLREQYPDDPDAAIALAGALIEKGDHKQAIEILKSQLEKNPSVESRRIRLALASAIFQSGDISAQVLFDALYTESPDDPAVLSAHLDALARTQKWPELIDRATVWFKAHAGQAVSVVNILEGILREFPQGSRQPVETTLRNLLTIQPDSVEILTALGVLLQSTGDSSSAAVFYQKALEKSPDHVVLLNNLAWILCEDQKEYGKALDLVNRAIAINPNYLDPVDTRGVIYFRLNQLDKSLTDLTRCVESYPERSPSLAGSFFHLGRTFLALKRDVDAHKAFQRALDLNQRYPSLSAEDLAETRRLLSEIKSR